MSAARRKQMASKSSFTGATKRGLCFISSQCEAFSWVVATELYVRSFAALLLQAAMTPIVGAAGKTFNRIILATIGTLIWGITNIGVGSALTFHQVCLMLSNAAVYMETTPV